MEKPYFVKDEHLFALDHIRETGITNMYGAVPYLKEIYPELTKEESKQILSYWMKTFSERHRKEESK